MPTKNEAETLKRERRHACSSGLLTHQGGLPIPVDGPIIGGIAASGVKPEIDEAVVQAGLDAVFAKK
jgi:uncharacterized protein GlcG (DUF336 family)